MTLKEKVYELLKYNDMTMWELVKATGSCQNHIRTVITNLTFSCSDIYGYEVIRGGKLIEKIGRIK